LGKKIGLLPQRSARILAQLLSKCEDVIKIIDDSGLSEKVKNTYKNAFKDKLRRMGMIQE
jgi:transketolase C-terminal domain/subunit